MNIEISNINIKESKSVPLLMEIIKIEQNEKEELSLNITKLNEKVSGLSKDILGFKDKCSVFEKEKTDLENKCSALETEKADLESKCSDFEKEKSELEGKCSTIEIEKSELENKYSTIETAKTEIEEKFSTLEAEKIELEDKCSVLEKKISDLEGKYSTLETEKSDLENILEKTKTKLLSDKLNTIQLLLNHAAAELPDNNWHEFIKLIITGIDGSINSQTCVENTLRDTLVKNGWLTKLASLHWWSNESHVKDFIPKSLNADSLLHKTFDDFLQYLVSNQIQISLPELDFSSKLEQYDADYDDDPKWFKVLFPQYQPKDYILCEVCYLSINSRKGQCLGYKTK